MHLLKAKSKELKVNEASFLCLFFFFFPCNLINVQNNQLGGEQGLKSKTKIRLSEAEGEYIIEQIFSCSSETLRLLNNLKFT